MRFGVKTYDSEEFLDKFNDSADFFEVQAIRSRDYSFLKKYDKEIVLHCEHDYFGIDIADSSILDKNIESIEFAKKLADEVGAKKIVIHPGYDKNEYCSLENTLDFLKKYCDKRFIIENMPLSPNDNSKFLIGSSPENIKFLLKETGLGFCFDINHAIEYALVKGLDCWEVIKEFEKLKPNHYHLGGQKVSEFVTHLSFLDSDLDLKKVFDLISKDAFITLEVGWNEKEVVNDLELVRSLDNKS